MLAQVNHKQVKAEEVKCRLFLGVFGFKESNTQIAQIIKIKGNSGVWVSTTTIMVTSNAKSMD